MNCECCNKPKKTLIGGVCKTCAKQARARRPQQVGGCFVAIRVSITNHETLEEIFTAIEDLRELHDANPWLGLDKIADTFDQAMKELDCEPA